MSQATDPETYQKLYSDFVHGNPLWNDIPADSGQVYNWAASTYIHEPPFFDGFTLQAPGVTNIKAARALAIFGDSVTTDHISPAGSIKPNSPAGQYLLALEYAVEGREHAARIGVKAPVLASAHVLVLAHLGRLEEARALAEQDLSEAEPLAYVSAIALYLRSLGFTELAAGNAELAATHFRRALTIADDLGIGEPAIMRLHPDAVAALVATGQIAEAERLVAQLDSSTQANQLPWSTAMAGRCHGLLHAANGDLPAAITVLVQALTDHVRLPMPFEEARTRLLLGTVLRRAGHRIEARRQLETAYAAFTDLGTPIQAEATRSELASIGGKHGTESELTPVERRIAALVGLGKTNREVASDLFISVRTVDSHLCRIYRKLDVRSRTQLTHRLTN